MHAHAMIDGRKAVWSEDRDRWEYEDTGEPVPDVRECLERIAVALERLAAQPACLNRAQRNYETKTGYEVSGE